MLSLKVFDRPNGEEMQKACKVALLNVLEALSHQAPAGDDSDHADFCDVIAQTISAVSAPQALAQDVLIRADAASEAIHQYNRKVVGAVRARRLELESFVALLTQTTAELGAGGSRSMARLKDIEHRLVKSTETFDLAELKSQMADCLQTVREEAACRHQETEHLIADLRANLEAATHDQAPPPAEDYLPGLREDPLAPLLAATLAKTRMLYVAVLTLDHLKSVALRFGDPAAERLAAFCAQQAKAALKCEVYPWKNRACVAFLDAVSGLSTIERDIAHEAHQRRTLTIETSGGREISLHASYLAWKVFPAQGRPPEAVLQDMTKFLDEAVKPARLTLRR